MSDATSNTSKRLAMTVANKEELYRAYMPFLKSGGLFVATNEKFQIGDDVLVLLTVLDQGERFPIEATVAWITPTGATNKRRAGIGVQFNDGAGNPKSKLEAFLGGSLSADRPTETM